jgi:large subunit ribosomal protein L3
VSVGILGTKLGMTQVFDAEGRAIPVTVIQAGPCTVTQIKTKQTDGYGAVQVGYGDVKPKALNKPELGHLAKSAATPLRHLQEYRLEDTSSFELGQQVKADTFTPGQIVDVIGTSIGKGFAGFQKRHNFKRGPCLTVPRTTASQARSDLELLPVAFIPGKEWQDVWATFKSPSAN